MPIRVINADSIRNSINISPFDAPIDFFIPISRVRSLTATIITVIIDKPETKSDIPAINVSIIVTISKILDNASFCPNKFSTFTAVLLLLPAIIAVSIFPLTFTFESYSLTAIWSK